MKSTGDVLAVARGRADAALIGEVLMRQDDPSETLSLLVDAAKAASQPA
jgi:indole-3-glycerol phosphate synthase